MSKTCSASGVAVVAVDLVGDAVLCVLRVSPTDVGLEGRGLPRRPGSAFALPADSLGSRLRRESAQMAFSIDARAACGSQGFPRARSRMREPISTPATLARGTKRMPKSTRRTRGETDIGVRFEGTLAQVESQRPRRPRQLSREGTRAVDNEPSEARAERGGVLVESERRSARDQIDIKPTVTSSGMITATSASPAMKPDATGIE